MPKMKWSELSPMQIGRYAEYYAEMKFIEINILTQKDHCGRTVPVSERI